MLESDFFLNSLIEDSFLLFWKRCIFRKAVYFLDVKYLTLSKQAYSSIRRGFERGKYLKKNKQSKTEQLPAA